MVVGVFYFELYIPASRSRKDKRMIINSLKKRLRNGHNIAVSEVGFLEEMKRSAIGMSTVCLRRGDAEKVFNAVYDKICDDFPVEITLAEKEYY
jgi:uncharacterized protein YlxP (DUF503 family)